MGFPDSILYPDGYVCRGVFCGNIGKCTYSFPADCPEDCAIQLMELHWRCGRIRPTWPNLAALCKREEQLHTGRHHEHQDLQDQDVPQHLHDGGQDKSEHRSMPQHTDDQPELPQLTGGHKLPDDGLLRATDGQPELRQLTDSVREERVQTIHSEGENWCETDVQNAQDDGSCLHDSHSHSWSEDDQSWLAHKTWAEDCSSWSTEDCPSNWQDKPSPVWHRTLLTDDRRDGELRVQVTHCDFDEDEMEQDGQPDLLQLPDVGLLQATEGQPELRQLTDRARKMGEPPDEGGVSPGPPDEAGVSPGTPGEMGVCPEPPDVRGVSPQPSDVGLPQAKDGQPELRQLTVPDDGGGPRDVHPLPLDEVGVTLLPPGDVGVTLLPPGELPDSRPQPRPPECQPELRQLTDTEREERDRVQTLCMTPEMVRKYCGGNAPYHLEYKYQPPIQDKVKTSLDNLVIATSFMTFDGGGDNDTLHVYTAAVPAPKLRTRLLTLQPTQFPIVI